MTQQQIDWMLSKIPIGRFGEIDEVASLVLLAGERGMQLLHRRGVRRLRRPRDLLTGAPVDGQRRPRLHAGRRQLAEMIRHEAALAGRIDDRAAGADRGAGTAGQRLRLSRRRSAMDGARARRGGADDRTNASAGCTACRSPSRTWRSPRTCRRRWAATIFAGNQPNEDTPIVPRLRDEGAIILGKTTTSEFGWTGVSHSPADRHHAQSVEARLQRRRVIGRRGRRGGGGLRAAAPGQRRRRIDPHAVAFLRRVRAEAEHSAACRTIRWAPATTPRTSDR